MTQRAAKKLRTESGSSDGIALEGETADAKQKHEFSLQLDAEAKLLARKLRTKLEMANMAASRITEWPSQEKCFKHIAAHTTVLCSATPAMVAASRTVSVGRPDGHCCRACCAVLGHSATKATATEADCDTKHVCVSSDGKTETETVCKALPAFDPRSLAVFAREVGVGGKRAYLAATHDDFWSVFSVMQKTTRHHYEVIREGAACRLYFDLEFSKRLNEGVNGDDLVDLLIARLHTQLQSAYGTHVQLPRSHVLELDSSNGDKFSRHLICFPFFEPTAQAEMETETEAHTQAHTQFSQRTHSQRTQREDRERERARHSLVFVNNQHAGNFVRKMCADLRREIEQEQREQAATRAEREAEAKTEAKAEAETDTEAKTQAHAQSDAVAASALTLDLGFDIADSTADIEQLIAIDPTGNVHTHADSNTSTSTSREANADGDADAKMETETEGDGDVDREAEHNEPCADAAVNNGDDNGDDNGTGDGDADGPPPLERVDKATGRFVIDIEHDHQQKPKLEHTTTTAAAATVGSKRKAPCEATTTADTEAKAEADGDDNHDGDNEASRTNAFQGLDSDDDGESEQKADTQTGTHAEAETHTRPHTLSELEVVLDLSGRRGLFIDEGVYTRNRCFRLFLARKRGKCTSLELAPRNCFTAWPSASVSPSAPSFSSASQPASVFAFSQLSQSAQRHAHTHAPTHAHTGAHELKLTAKREAVFKASLITRIPEPHVVAVSCDDVVSRAPIVNRPHTAPSTSTATTLRRESSPWPRLDRFVAQQGSLHGGPPAFVRSWSLVLASSASPPASASASSAATTTTTTTTTTEAKSSDVDRSSVESIVFNIGGNRYCANVGRQHKSNGVYYVAHIRTRALVQKCHDPDCKARDFRSASVRIPDFVFDDADTEGDRDEEFESALLTC